MFWNKFQVVSFFCTNDFSIDTRSQNEFRQNRPKKMSNQRASSCNYIISLHLNKLHFIDNEKPQHYKNIPGFCQRGNVIYDDIKKLI